MPEIVDSPLDKPLVLLVEADAAEAALVRRAFEQAGDNIHLMVESDTKSALEMLRSDSKAGLRARPFLVLLGLEATGGAASEFLKTLKSDKLLRRTPVVACTRLENEMAVREFYDLHGNAFVVKAAEFSAFVEQMRALCRYWFKVLSLSPR